MKKPSWSRIRERLTARRLAAVVAALAVGVAAGVVVVILDDDGDEQAVETPRLAPVSIALGNGVPEGTVIGVVLSNAGPGRNYAGMVGGAYVAAHRLNDGRPDRVRLVVEDDGGDPAQAVAAVERLVEAGAAGIVYGSAGPQFVAAADAAARLGVPLLAPYAGDVTATTDTSSVYLTGPTDEQAVARLRTFADGRGWTRLAFLAPNGAAGDRAVQAVRDRDLAAAISRFDDSAAGAGQAMDAALANEPDAVVVWGGVDAASGAVAAVDAADATVAVVLGPQAGVPAFGRTQAGLLAPSAVDGLLSVGTWAGPWIPTTSVDLFFAARAAAVAAGAITGEATDADIASHDAVLALAEAARLAGRADRAAVASALPRVTVGVGQAGGAGVPLGFGRPAAVQDGAVAMLTYTTFDDGSGRTAPLATGGGHWVAVDGTFELPPALRGLFESNGG